MSDLVDLRVAGDQVVLVFEDSGRAFEVTVSVQTGVMLVTRLSQGIVDLSPPNPPGVRWLGWPQMVKSSDVSFDIESVGDRTVGIALKLPGLLPLTVEIPADSARQLVHAISTAANESEELPVSLEK
jgi:hypothetical protein